MDICLKRLIVVPHLLQRRKVVALKVVAESLVPFASPYPIRRHLIYTPGYTAVFEKAVQVFFVGVLMEIQVVRMLRWVSSLSSNLKLSVGS